MATVRQEPRAPMWPWGGPREVRGRLLNRAQLERKGTKKKGDPRNPALASAALIDSIGPAHSAEELRLPQPPMPPGHDADLEGYADLPYLSNVVERMNALREAELERGLGAVRAAPDRIERLRSLLGREGRMLALVSQLRDEIAEIDRRRREEQVAEGY